MLALTQALPQTYGNLVTQSAGDHDYLVELEYRELGGDHAEAGGWLARQWRLPEIYRICVCGSHNIGDAGTSVEGTDSVKVVAISGLLADVWVGEDREIAVRKAHEKAGKLLDLKEPEIEQILTRIADSIPEISDPFRIPLDDAETIRDILEQARNALTKVSKKVVQDAHLANLKTMQMASENQELKQLTKQDALTGLYNRVHLDKFLADEFEWAVERRQSLSVLFCDIDHFKQINDAYGHQAGDCILVSVAHALADEVRQHDWVARYGGEEFVVVLPSTDGPEAKRVSERIRQVISSKTYRIGSEESVRITVSVGYASHTPEQQFDNANELLPAADQALLKAKKHGKDRVVAYSADLNVSEEDLEMTFIGHPPEIALPDPKI